MLAKGHSIKHLSKGNIEKKGISDLSRHPHHKKTSPT